MLTHGGGISEVKHNSANALSLKTQSKNAKEEVRQKSCVLLYEAMTKLADERMGAGSSARKGADFSWFQSEPRILIRIDAKNGKLFLPVLTSLQRWGKAEFVGVTPHSWRRGRNKRRELGNELVSRCD